MAPDKVQFLRNIHPKLFSQLESIDIGDGWYNLLRSTLIAVELEISNLPVELQAGIYLKQIKEKFGGIRIYFNHTTPHINGVIALAELLSNSTCETCGLPGEHKNLKGWVCTMCDECFKNKYLSVKG